MAENKIKDFLKKIFIQDKEEPLDDGKDNVLESLRRENEKFDNEEEKQYLKKLLIQRKQDRVRKYMFGIKDESKNKEVNVLKNLDMNQNKLINNQKGILKQTNRFKNQNRILNQKRLIKIKK